MCLNNKEKKGFVRKCEENLTYFYPPSTLPYNSLANLFLVSSELTDIMITKQKLGKALLKALLVSPLNIANSRGKWSLSSLELSLPPPTVVHDPGKYPSSGRTAARI